MSEWWTYRPSDFLMFSVRTWDRLVQGWNEALWPLHVPVLLVAAALVVLAALRPQQARRPALLLLAISWAFIGWGFHWERFATIHTGAPWYAAAFGLQALLLLLAAASPEGATPPGPVRTTGLLLAAAAVAPYPLWAPAAGRGWPQAEIAGLLPDPTALLTVGLLLALPQRHRGWLLVVPLLALVVGWTTAWLLRAD